MNETLIYREQIVEFGKRLYNQNYIGGTEGNLSTRLPDGGILITPAGINKGFMRPEDLVICTIEGFKLFGHGSPSSELKMHLAIYNSRPDVNAICHAHPIFATAFSVAGKDMLKPALPEIAQALKGIPLAPFAEPGSMALAKSILPFIQEYDAILLQSHGAIAFGKNLEEAFNKIEMLERMARISFIAERLGQISDLGLEEIEALLKQSGLETHQ
jgi:L-fuculose-phosphate aldolase